MEEIRKVRSGKAYEAAVGRVLRGLFPGAVVRRDVRLLGASGVMHQVDLEMEVSGKRYLVECKNHRRPVGKDLVGAFLSVVSDLSCVGILVSSGGFRSGAVEMARFHGLLLFEVRRPLRKDFVRYRELFVREVRSASSLGVSLRTGDRIRIVLEEGAAFPPGWRSDTPLAADPDSLYLDGVSLRDLLERAAASVSVGGVRRVVLKTPGKVLRHQVYPGELPVRRIVFSFVSLNPDMEETVVFGSEKPDWVIADPVHALRWGLWGNHLRLLPDPVPEVRDAAPGVIGEWTEDLM